jgi:hypothetical protein
MSRHPAACDLQTWYHDDSPAPNGGLPVPEGGCIVACRPSNASTCPASPQIQIFDVILDESERTNLAQNVSLLTELLEVMHKYNNSAYVVALGLVTPDEHSCPFNDKQGSVTPCSD